MWALSELRNKNPTIAEEHIKYNLKILWGFYVFLFLYNIIM